MNAGPKLERSMQTRSPGAAIHSAGGDGFAGVATVGSRPTIVQCDSFSHPLANKEFLCPYASVVEVPQARMLEQIGYSLAVTAITKDPAFIAQLEAFPEIERLNIGPVSTMKISWDQPHEGNMFEFLWKRRSIERAW